MPSNRDRISVKVTGAQYERTRRHGTACLKNGENRLRKYFVFSRFRKPLLACAPLNPAPGGQKQAELRV